MKDTPARNKTTRTPRYHWWHGFVAGLIAMGWVCIAATATMVWASPHPNSCHISASDEQAIIDRAAELLTHRNAEQ